MEILWKRTENKRNISCGETHPPWKSCGKLVEEAPRSSLKRAFPIIASIKGKYRMWCGRKKEDLEKIPTPLSTPMWITFVFKHKV